ncbi:MAG: FAD-binding oxidoreductase [Gammaproteobacteria bacterium]|nr:FAD-binding oxidoreductase [Gammaproteobacteria bacterium]
MSPDSSLFSKHYREEPYWQEGTTDVSSPTAHALDTDLPAKADVVIIGSGYTGLNTALQTARANRSTVVIEAGEPGQGCSTRNGGQISTSVKPAVEQLAKKVGLERARAIRREGETALEWIETFVRSEKIDCDFQRNGRFHAAHTPEHYSQIARQAETLTQKEGIEAFAVPRSEQRTELGTDAYHGGIVFPRHASLHAGKYHQGLLRAAVTAGVELIAHCAATSIKPLSENRNTEFEVHTEQGVIRARDVMIATNGYTGKLTPWFQRRIIPIGSYIIATEPLRPALVDELFPTDRIASDTCRVVYYYRASPDRTRILFGGRVSANETNPAISGPRLHQQMCRIFPQLANVKISHSWAGKVGYTFDTLAHTGRHQGQYYALGFCGSGVSMASYLGMRAGQKIIGDRAGKTAFDDLPFATRPLYQGKPWFLPPVVSWYRWRDKVEYTRAAADR